jgi:hypothetical protein
LKLLGLATSPRAIGKFIGKLVGKLIGRHSLIAPCWSLSPRTTTPDDLPPRLANSARSSNAAYRDEQSRESSPF